MAKKIQSTMVAGQILVPTRLSRRFDSNKILIAYKRVDIEAHRGVTSKCLTSER